MRLYAVVVVDYGTEVRVYPITILQYHIVINDVVAGNLYSIAYSPVSGIYRVFSGQVKNEKLIFGHTGNLYKNTDLLVDFQNDTLWSIESGQALVGVMAGAPLDMIDLKIMNYASAI